ncbi:hypothetical protein EGW08_022066 [Elysia chlorotica]|uniref:Major facilitator superfamily (MFS) profile domain-containing protein n=1 Tax=Elysia chlorotica TaxID=188477 RepID=A0A433SLX1_ELYCH|nr:hypothetical protein EGW08_022066 [Elysia chlorotica]
MGIIKYQSQASCDVTSPVVVAGENGADFSTNENEFLNDVTQEEDGREVVHMPYATDSQTSNVPVIINTPPSPAIVQDSNRHSADCAKFVQAQNTPENRTSNISSMSESNIKDVCKQTHTKDPYTSSASFPTNNKTGEAVIVNDENNIAIIVPSSGEYVNRNMPNQSSDECPSNLVNSDVILATSTRHDVRNIDQCNLTHTDTSHANLHLENQLDSKPIESSNLDPPLNSKPISGCSESNFDTQNDKISDVNADVGHHCLNNNNNNNNNIYSGIDREKVIDTPDTRNDNKRDFKNSDIDISDSQPECEQSPPLHLRPFWRVQEPSVGKFKVARIYNSDDHINSIKSSLTAGGEGNSHGDAADGSSNNHLYARRKAEATQQTLSPLAAMDLGKSQAVSLYGINGYSSQHPHHHHQQHHLRRRHPHSNHHHSFYELGGSRVEMADNLSNGGRKRMARGSSTHLAAYHYFGSMASFGAAVTHTSSAENVDVIRTDAKIKGGHSCGKVCDRWFPTRLLKDPLFLLLLVGFVMWTGQSITMTYLPTYAVSLGLERSQAAYLISIIGIVNVIGRPLAGLITDCLPIPSIWLYLFALLLAAVTNFVIPMCKSYNLLATCAAVFGLCMAVAVSMRTIVLVDQMGLDALTESFGIVALFQGIAFIVIPPIAGSMIDHFKSSKPTFWMSAAMYTVSAAMMLAVICVGRRRTRAQDQTVMEVDI